MRITLLTYGSRGDVQPFIALGSRLQQAGHAVRLAAPERFAVQAQTYGMTFTPLPGDVEAMTRDMVDKAGGNVLRLLSVMIRASLDVVVEMAQRCFAATEGAEMVVHSFLTAASGHSSARIRRAHDISAQGFPFFATTGEFPQVTSPELPLGAGYNRLTHELSHRMIRFVTTTSYQMLHQPHHTLPPPLQWPALGTTTPVLQAYSSLVVPRPADWPAGIHQTGFWFLDEGKTYVPPPELSAFLEAGPPPVVIGFSSANGQEARRFLELSVHALRLTGKRGLLLGGWDQGNLDTLASSDQVLALRDVPHDWIYPRASAIVHHGGAGTTGAALRAGVPAVITPIVADQFFWARRAYQIGASPAPLIAAKMNAETLAAAITATNDPTMRRRAAAIGYCIQSEDGVGNAVRIIEQLAETKLG